MITREQVRYVARLGRLTMSAKEEKEMTSQLDQMLDYFNMLKDVKTDDVPPTVHAVEVANVLRADVVKPSLPVDAVLANAPASSAANFFVVPKVVDKES